jgi:hypothetical protein
MLQMISPGSLQQYDEFGAAVACGLDDFGTLWLAVGVPGRDNDAGAVWMYLHDSASDTWTLQETLQPAGLQSGDRFGDALALDGDLLVIGAPGADNDGGAVHVHRLSFSNQTWDATYLVAANESSASGDFGASVGVSGYHILIGAPDGAGHASLWKDISTAGLLVHSMDLPPDDWTNIEGWGTAVSIEGTRLLIGGPPHTGSGPDGVAAVFRQTDNDEYQIVAMLGEGDWGSDARHGTCVLLDEMTAWIGAPPRVCGWINRRRDRSMGCAADPRLPRGPRLRLRRGCHRPEHVDQRLDGRCRRRSDRRRPDRHSRSARGAGVLGKLPLIRPIALCPAHIRRMFA